VPPAARTAILDWYAVHGRPLAFRRTRDPYAVLVSEVMAQQTQAARAAVHWERFLARFPTVRALAAASPADVLRAWQGLGYDRRALALWRAAGLIVERHGGEVPSSVEALVALPGVGRYTARAVAAIAFGLPVGAVDVNVRRVLGRIAAGDPAVPAAAIQALADAAVPPGAPGAWTHAVMDIGATVCRPRAPRCGDCPARPWCAAARSAEARDARPAPPARPTPVRRRTPSVARPFAATNRWLRGRILDRLRAVPDGEWTAIEAPMGQHAADAIARAVERMAADGVLEVIGTTPEGAPIARLPVA
jgi:A/G-specific adenine glycosylase